MSLLGTLQQKWGFTRKEAVAILTLSATFLVGLGIRWLHREPSRSSVVRVFDYSRTDSIYAALARNATQKPSPAVGTKKHQRPLKNNSVSPAPINLNTATKQHLMSLPGIGPAFAERILAYRKQRGAFTSVDELVNVKGIGKKKLQKLRQFLYTQ
ncbi:MAG: hypothetical protein C4326_11900 [Ignavibacteria bacterium]